MDFANLELKRRCVPDALINNRGVYIKTPSQMKKRREELKKILIDEEYGSLPPRPEHMSFSIRPGIIDFCAGKVISETVLLSFVMNGSEFSFPIRAAIPKREGKIPAFVHINFSPDTPDKYQPTEEITDRGFAVFSFCYEDVTADNADFKSKCARHLLSSRRAKNSSGKIMMWAWAAMRVMDYIESLPNIDLEHIAVIGHSVLGKAALVAAAFDERFKYAVSNCSGCSGAAISRGNTGESIERIAYSHYYLFCPRYAERTNPFEKHFDQNFLMALIAPRHIVIGSAANDLWSDPKSEFLGCASADSVYKIYGKSGLIYGDDFPSAPSVLNSGCASYHIRQGLHYLSREDWAVYMDFIEEKMIMAKS